MPYDFTHMCNLKKTKQVNKQANKKQNQTYKYRERTDGCKKEGGRGMGEMGDGECSTGFQLWNERVTGMKGTAY